MSKLTDDKIRQNAEAYAAWLRGEKVEYLCDADTNTWNLLCMESFRADVTDILRIKPQLDPYQVFRDAEEAGKTVQFHGGDLKWFDQSGRGSLSYEYPPDQYRIKTDAEYIPWDFTSRPREVTWVYKKGFITDSQIMAWGDDNVTICCKHGLINATYEELFKNWLRRDSTPCGTLKENS